MTVQPALVATNVPGFDAVLGGGLVSGSLVFFVGTPGAGKTILASQIIFGAARRGVQSVVFTSYSEGSVKYVEHLRQLTFFDDTLVGGNISLFSLPSLIGDEPSEAAQRIVQTVRQNNANIVLIDGFQGVAALLGTPEMMRRTLADIAALASFLNVTIIVTLEGIARNPQISASLTTADVVIGLDYTVEHGRHTRTIDVIKQRGIAPLNGVHSYSISSDGLTVYPRIESLPIGAFPTFELGRATFGLPELDQMLGGGLTVQTTTLLAGAPGVGKTTLGMYWGLAEATPEAATVFIGFGEYPGQLHVKAATFGLDLEPALASGAFRVVRLSPVDIVPDMVAAMILDALEPNVCRLVLDGIGGLLFALGERGGIFLTALAQQCYQRGITTMLLLEIEPMSGLRVSLVNSPLSLVSENVLVLQQIIAAGRLHRLLAVLKMRFSAYDQTLREIVMDHEGVHVLAPAQSAANVLNEAAHTGGGFAPTGSNISGQPKET